MSEEEGDGGNIVDHDPCAEIYCLQVAGVSSRLLCRSSSTMRPDIASPAGALMSVDEQNAIRDGLTKISDTSQR